MKFHPIYYSREFREEWRKTFTYQFRQLSKKFRYFVHTVVISIYEKEN